MPKGTLADAAEYMGALAKQLSLLSLLVAINDDNLKGLQGDAERSWQKAASGWRQYNLFGGRYIEKKQEITGGTEPGVLSGGWKAFRTLAAADIVLSGSKKGLKLNLKASDYTSRELSKRRAYEGRGNIPKKPWRNWPQRFVDLTGIPFSCKVAARIPGSNAATIKEAQKGLPFGSVRVIKQKLGREGRRIGTIRRRRPRLQASLRRAINAV